MMMLKRLLIPVLLTLAVLPASAQIGAPRRTFAIGGNIGATSSSIDFSPKIKQQMYLGNTFGVTARYTSEKYFFLICAAQLEINYSDRGWNELIKDGSGNEYSRRIPYIEMPFFAHLGIGREARGVQWFLNLGPQIGYALNSIEKMGGTGPWDTSMRPNKVTEQYGKPLDHKFEYGIAAGTGIEIKSKAGNFIAEGRYYFGLSDIFGNSKKDFFGRSANMVIYAKLAYMIEWK